MINFIKYSRLYALISIVTILLGFFAMMRFGLKLSIDFTGGSVVSYTFRKPQAEDAIRQVFKKEKVDIIEMSRKKDTEALVRTKPMNEKQEVDIRASLSATLKRFDSVGPSLGQETVRKTAIASLAGIIGILLYVSFTFKRFNYGIAAIVALLHDICVLIGTYAILGMLGAEFDALFITALLTTMSFSVHDTIVVFDKIREYRKTSGLSITDIANRSLTETIVRSLNNSLTIVLMLVPLTFIGGESLRFFAAALLIGTITGTYSSPFIATPLLVFFEKRRK
ncbi:protein-export membrane protein SecF [Candidatus Roizmanbacteria bacterium RIFCSPLOWO2_02_FULL_43_10]|uniref:Protein-export membrane protein SecF n=3 Tax=Candidatus Roizmaniibacteriota TaxID=1752723 RepID=A0A1F7JZW1_9BACT|nr:MAG: protein-export membrane protein SecF [Candidatus Roizmanbacteria bacterium RIFCSPHIGHO2_02_FULL_43_11]OGK38350.1 MAG: protein-export membrane protein SecF [Candidatus Roizmanbacteria bacterium RIFCSPHIGHO2_12_FULL_42_10]OGK61131.1 MAG: protein-export membrane protein SecF [Candidatus Roizmanbacteria bacterium RIFCSPLOWO2_02_FULL_43_10]